MPCMDSSAAPNPPCGAGRHLAPLADGVRLCLFNAGRHVVSRNDTTGQYLMYNSRSSRSIFLSATTSSSVTHNKLPPWFGSLRKDDSSLGTCGLSDKQTFDCVAFCLCQNNPVQVISTSPLFTSGPDHSWWHGAALC